MALTAKQVVRPGVSVGKVMACGMIYLVCPKEPGKLWPWRVLKVVAFDMKYVAGNPLSCGACTGPRHINLFPNACHRLWHSKKEVELNTKDFEGWDLGWDFAELPILDRRQGKIASFQAAGI